MYKYSKTFQYSMKQNDSDTNDNIMHLPKCLNQFAIHRNVHQHYKKKMIDIYFQIISFLD